MSKEPKAFQVPQYQIPTPDNVSMFGTTASKSGDTWGVTQSGIDQQTMDQVKQIRGDLLKSLGIGGGSEYDPYTNKFMQETLRQSQPRLENALIGRGMGGSSVYANALTDLMSKAGTQAVLSGQQYKNNNLAQLQNYLQQQQGLGQALLALQQQAYGNKANLYDKQYQQILAQAMSDYDNAQQPKTWELGLSKMMSIADPGGSYMGMYQNPRQTKGASAQSMQGLGRAMELYSAYQDIAGGMGGKGGGGGTSNIQSLPANTQTQDYSWLQRLLDENGYSGFGNKNYSSLTGSGY